MAKADDTVWFEFVELKVFSKQVGELQADVLTNIQSDLVQNPERGDIVKGTHAFGRRELPSQAHRGERAVATVICIFNLNVPAEFTCYTYSAKVSKPTCHRIKRVSSAR